MNPFRPLPLLGNPHIQTIIGNLWKGTATEPPTSLLPIAFPDGDVLIAHDSLPRRWRTGDPVAVLVHGLGGSHRSGYMVRMAATLHQRGWRVFRLDLRGAGASAGLSRRLYNAAASEEVRVALEAIHQTCPTSPLVLIGFSLGGNIVLKLLGETPVPGLAALAAVAPPIDLARCSSMLAEPRNRFYDQHFARSLVKQVRRYWRFFPDVPRVQFPKGVTLRGFDEIFTAPHGGFADALDYYRRASALPLLGRIDVPTLVITARDDPFIAVEPFQKLSENRHIELEITNCGGHLGFLGWDGAGGVRWAEQRVVEWVMQTIKNRPLS